MTAYRLLQLGWTQEEVGNKIEMSQDSVSNFLREFSDLKKVVKNLLNGGLPHLDVAERYNIDVSNLKDLDIVTFFSNNDNRHTGIPRPGAL